VLGTNSRPSNEQAQPEARAAASVCRSSGHRGQAAEGSARCSHSIETFGQARRPTFRGAPSRRLTRDLKRWNATRMDSGLLTHDAAAYLEVTNAGTSRAALSAERAFPTSVASCPLHAPPPTLTALHQCHRCVRRRAGQLHAKRRRRSETATTHELPRKAESCGRDELRRSNTSEVRSSALWKR